MMGDAPSNTRTDRATDANYFNFMTLNWPPLMSLPLHLSPSQGPHLSSIPLSLFHQQYS